MRVGIIGSRTCTNRKYVFDTLDNLRRDLHITHVVSGGARGADSLAQAYAVARNIPITVHKANWDRDGRSAGYIRNQVLVDNVDIIIAFWDGHSKGTAHALETAKRRGVPYRVFNYEDKIE